MTTAGTTFTNSPLQRARALAPLVEEKARQAEKERTLPRDLVAALRGAGLISCFLPKVCGGEEPGFRDLIELWEEMARQDGSVGWIGIANGPSSAFGAAFLPDEGYQQVFAKGPDICMGGQFFPNGQGDMTDGGFKISGAWQFGSGMDHSDYVCGGFFPMKNGEMLMLDSGMPDMRVAVMPREHITVTDNWHVMGLKGTGSFDYTASELFVPEYMTYPLFTRHAHRGGAVYQMGIMPYTAAGHGGWALGVARRMLDEMRALAKSKVRMGDPNTVANKLTFQKEFATGEAKLQAAKLLLIDSFEKAQQEKERIGNEDLPIATRARMRLAASYATEIAKEVTDMCHLFAGTTAIREDSVMERFFRDMHTGTQHAFIGEKTFSDAAQVMLGLTEENISL